MKPHALACAAALIALAAPLAACTSFGAKSTAELRSAADEAFRQAEYERVVLLDSELIRRSSDDFDATLQRGIAQDRLGRSNDAKADFTRALELREDAVLPRLYRANLSLRGGQVDAAEADLRALALVELRPHEKIATLTMTGTAHQLRGDHRQALRYFDQAIALGRRSPDPRGQKHVRDALSNAAASHYSEGDIPSAAARMQEFAESKRRAGRPLGQDDHYMLGVLHYLLGEFDAAREHFAHVSSQHRARAAELLDDESFFAARS